MRIPVADPSRYFQSVATSLEQAFSRVLKSGKYILGSEVELFERRFSELHQSRFGVSVANGTDALVICLKALQVQNCEVIVAPNAGGYSSTAVELAGGKPVWSDVDPTTGLMDSRSILDRVSSQTKAIVVTHLYGLAYDVKSLKSLLDSNGLSAIEVIEDCAQAHGGSVAGRSVGSVGLAGCFSFYPTKNLGAIGDGGMIVTSDPEFAVQLASLRQYGWSRRYVRQRLGGTNSRLDELQAAILNMGLNTLAERNRARFEILKRYYDSGIPLLQGASLGKQHHVGHLAVARFRNRDEVMRHLENLGVGTAIHYPMVDPSFPIYRDATALTSIPNARMLSEEVLSLPCFPELTDAEVTRVIAAVKEAQSMLT